MRLVDTAGVRETADPVERLGVERSRRAMEEAQLILVVADRCVGLTQEDMELCREAVGLAPTILVWNKCDLPAGDAPVPLEALPDAVEVSAKTGAGLEALGEKVDRLFPHGAKGEGEALLTNARQTEAAERALTAVERAGSALKMGVTPDALLTDVEEALSALGELTGKTVREDVTDRIFSRFCVGK